MKGGQGRTPDDIERDSGLFAITFAIAGALLAIMILTKGC